MSTDTSVDAERREDESTLEEDGEMSHDAIAHRAYEISLSAESGGELDNWLQAEREMSGEPAAED